MGRTAARKGEPPTVGAPSSPLCHLSAPSQSGWAQDAQTTGGGRRPPGFRVPGLRVPRVGPAAPRPGGRGGGVGVRRRTERRHCLDTGSQVNRPAARGSALSGPVHSDPVHRVGAVRGRPSGVLRLAKGRRRREEGVRVGGLMVEASAMPGGRDLEARAHQMLKCAERFAFLACEDCGGYRFIGPGWRCGDRLCPTCAHHRARRLVARYAPKVIEEARGRRLLFLTVTMKNVERLTPEVYAKLKRCFKRMRRHRSFAAVRGGVLAIETTRNHQAATWHPHLHAVLIARRYLNQDQLQREWRELTGDSYIVKVRKADRGSVRELLKYPVKLPELKTPAEVLEIALAMSGVRMLQGWGCLYRLREIEDQGGPLDGAELEPFVCGGCGSSRLRLEFLRWHENPPGPIVEGVRSVPRSAVGASRGP